MAASGSAAEAAADAVDSLSDVEMCYREELNRDWEKLEDVQQNLERLEPFGGLSPQDNPLQQLTDMKTRKMAAEIAILDNRDKPADVLPKDEELLEAVAVNELEVSIKQLEENLLLLTSQNESLERDLEREKEALRKETELKDSLEIKLAEISEQEDDWQEIDEQPVKIKIQKANDYLSNLISKMSIFLNEHFPHPGTENTKKKKSKSGDAEPNFYSLQQILEELMNECFERPQDPYITLTEAYWEPYVELLLRCGIALRDPDDSNRIKLVPFHLQPDKLS